MSDDSLILHQPSHKTEYNRHPDVFAAAAEIVGKQEASLLSFGCSSGEECRSLRSYMPKAHVVGAEISLPLVKANQQKNEDANITFIHSTFAHLEKHGPYDMIFAINVLIRDVENPFEFPLYVFEYFEKQLVQFDALLKEGGHLVLVHTQHDFCQSSLFKSGQYKEVRKQFYQKLPSQ